MAPKRPEKDAAQSQATKKKRKGKKTVAPERPPEQQPANLARRTKPPRADFLNEVAAASGLDRPVVETALAGLHTVVARQIREQKFCRIPNMLQLRLKIVPPQAAYTRMAFGREIQVKARDRTIKKVAVSALKPLKTAAVG